MPDETPVLDLPYPKLNERVDGPGSLRALAEQIEAVVATLTALAAHLTDTADAHDASAVSIVATAGLVGADVQAALEDLSARVTALEP